MASPLLSTQTCSCGVVPGAEEGDRVLCWGAPPFKPPIAARGISKIASSDDALCYISADLNDISCVGAINHPPRGAFDDLVVAKSGACAIARDGAVECWGKLAGTTFRAEPGASLLIHKGKACALSPSGHQVLCSDGEVEDTSNDDLVERGVDAGMVCQLSSAGLACRDGGRLVPTPPVGDNAHGLVVANPFGCVISDGLVKCFGDGPKPLAPARAFKAVSPSLSAVCALTASGELQCSGDSRVTRAMPRSGTYSMLRSSDLDFCALSQSDLVCWGASFGDAKTQASRVTSFDISNADLCYIRDRELRCKRNRTLEKSGVASVALSDIGGCVLRDNGSTSCWGSHRGFGEGKRFERLRAGGEVMCGRSESEVPKQTCTPTTTALSSADDVALGPRIRCGLKRRGELGCHGDCPIYPPGRFHSVETSGLLTCAISMTGSLECWSVSCSATYSRKAWRQSHYVPAL